MSEYIENPQDIIDQQSEFGLRETGITHPDNNSFIRIQDDGDIVISAGEGVFIVLHKKSRSITISADHIKLITRHEDGLRWNRLSLNDRATTFSEPTFLEIDDNTLGLFRGVDYFTKDEE